MFLNDQEMATDLLYYAPIAKTVQRLLHESRGTPVTIGVHGDWGAGKSSVLKMTQQLLNADKRVCCTAAKLLSISRSRASHCGV